MSDKNGHNHIPSKVSFILFDFKFEHAAVEVLYILCYDMQAVLLKITVCQMKVFLNKAKSILINYARLINYAYAYLLCLPILSPAGFRAKDILKSKLDIHYFSLNVPLNTVLKNSEVSCSAKFQEINWDRG